VGSSRGPALAALCLVCAAACYLVAFRLLDRDGCHGRNFYTYSTFAILLVVTGSRILLPDVPASIAWSVMAVAGAACPRLTLQVHGAIYLVLGLTASHALQQTAGLLLGDRTWSVGDQWAIWMGAAATAICCLLGTDAPGWIARALRIARGAALVLLTAAATAGLLNFVYHAIFGAEATHAYCATLRTAVIAAAALLLARFGRLAPLIYPLMILGAWRLVTVDLHQEKNAALFLSLLLYGATLILLPRAARRPTVSES
jgi:hypothetical protein